MKLFTCRRSLSCLRLCSFRAKVVRSFPCFTVRDRHFSSSQQYISYLRPRAFILLQSLATLSPDVDFGMASMKNEKQELHLHRSHLSSPPPRAANITRHRPSVAMNKWDI